MIDAQISSCLDYFCSGSVPFYMRGNSSNIHFHRQMITYCLYCDRPDFDEFQNALSTNASCTQFIDRNETCPEGKCGADDVCIDSHEVLVKRGYKTGELVQLSICYLTPLNAFYDAADIYPYLVIPVEQYHIWHIKVPIHVIVLVVIALFLIIPTAVELLPPLFKNRNWESFKNLFGLRYVCIYSFTVSQLTMILFYIVGWVSM